jgi:uncharacterized SAM-binding protein YcdF (DUF218 family)
MKEFLDAAKKKAIKYISLLAIITAIILWPGIIFYPMGALLYRNDHPKDNADAVWLLMGGVEVRPAAAAKAFLGKVANRIIFVTSEMSVIEEQGLMPSEQVLTMNILKSYGIDDSKITVVNDFGRVTSTVEEADAMLKLITTTGLKPKRLVVVTSWPHSARAGWIIEKALTGTGTEIDLLPVDAIPYDKSNWWKSERGLLFVFEEYIKWARYLIKYLGRDIS